MEGDGEPQPAAAPVSDHLQDLLSRAVENQLSEQQQMVAMVGEVQRLVADLREEMRAVGQDSVGQIAADFVELRQELRASGTAPVAVGQLADRVEEAGLRLAALPNLDDVPLVARQLVRLDDQLSAMETRLPGLYAVGDELARVADEVSALGHQLAAAPKVPDLDLVLDRMRGMVEASAAETEQRLAVHIDEAVFALASALLHPSVPDGPAPVETPTPPAAEQNETGASAVLTTLRREFGEYDEYDDSSLGTEQRPAEREPDPVVPPSPSDPTGEEWVATDHESRSRPGWWRPRG